MIHLTGVLILKAWASCKSTVGAKITSVVSFGCVKLNKVMGNGWRVTLGITDTTNIYKETFPYFFIFTGTESGRRDTDVWKLIKLLPDVRVCVCLCKGAETVYLKFEPHSSCAALLKQYVQKHSLYVQHGFICWQSLSNSPKTRLRKLWDIFADIWFRHGALFDFYCQNIHQQTSRPQNNNNYFYWKRKGKKCILYIIRISYLKCCIWSIYCAVIHWWNNMAARNTNL